MVNVIIYLNLVQIVRVRNLFFHLGVKPSSVFRTLWFLEFTDAFLFHQLMTDVTGNPEEERRTEFYQEPWVPEAVGRYIYSKVSRHR